MKSEYLTPYEFEQKTIKETEKEIKNIVLSNELTFNQKFIRLKYFYLENYKPNIIGFYGRMFSLKIAVATATLEILINKGNKEAKMLYDALKNDKHINQIKEVRGGLNG